MSPLRLVVGISGGPDSTALCHLLRQLGEQRRLELIWIHIDHKWRSESSTEAKELRQHFRDMGLHLLVFELNQGDFRGNLEAHCRAKRLEIFSQIAREIRAEALVLAHHADDRLEGALKRFFEGSELAHLHAAPAADVQIGSLRILRPLLHSRKGEILKYLGEKELSFFEDSTNRDPKLWRGFVRTWLLPRVQKALAKEIHEPLHRVLQYSKEIEELLDLWIAREKALKVRRGFAGVWLTLPARLPPIVLRHLLRKVAASYSCSLPFSSAERIARALEIGQNVKIPFGQCQMICCQNEVFFLPKPLQWDRPSSQIVDREGELCLGIWRVRVKRIRKGDEGSSQSSHASWRDVWRGKFQLEIAGSHGTLILPSPGLRASNSRQTLFAHWSKRKIPAFLRPWIPVVITAEGSICDWLSPKSPVVAGAESATWGWSLSFSPKKGAERLESARANCSKEIGDEFSNLASAD